MIADRPKMAGHIQEEDAVYQWAARQFAGESAPNKVYWFNEAPTRFKAQHRSPTESRAGRIQLAGTFGGRLLEFEELWASAIFELLNISNAKDFRAVRDQALKGELSRDEFVAANYRLEFIAAARTRKFYLAEFSSLMKREKLEFTPRRWFFDEHFMRHWRKSFSNYEDRLDYPWTVYGPYYDTLAKRRNQAEEPPLLDSILEALRHRFVDPPPQ